MAAKKSPAVAARKSDPSKTAAAPKQRTAATPRSASRKSTKTGDELVTIDRRRNEESAPAPALERRAKVQRRRELPTRIIQAGQVLAQDRVIEPNLSGDLSPIDVPSFVGKGPLQYIPPLLVGRGFRPEHVRTPDVHSS